MHEPTAPAYYDRRAPEYDDWYLGEGLYAGRARDGFDEELACVEETLAGLLPARTLDVACGTGFLTRHFRGTITGLDRSSRMLAIAAERLPHATLVEGDGLALPFPDDAFDRVVSDNFYGHLGAAQRPAASPRGAARRARAGGRGRIARPFGRRRGMVEPRPLVTARAGRSTSAGSHARGLLEELGGGDVLLAGEWFVVVRSAR